MTSSRRTQVVDADRLAALTSRSNRAGLNRLLQQVAALGGCVVLTLTLPSPVSWVPYLAFGVLLTFGFCPAHEAIHGSAFASARLNRLVAFVFGLVLVLPPRYFESFHMAHHRHTQIPGRDPELASPKPGSVGAWVLHVSGIRYWTAQISGLISCSLGKLPEFVPERRRQGVMSEARLVIAIYVTLVLISLISGSTVLWWWWLLPVLIGQPFLRLFLLAEHTGCPFVKDMFENTRTTNTNRIVGWLCWNMNHHTAHHAYAGIPFWRLAEASELLRSYIQVQAPGYFAVNRDVLLHLDEPEWESGQ